MLSFQIPRAGVSLSRQHSLFIKLVMPNIERFTLWWLIVNLTVEVDGCYLNRPNQSCSPSFSFSLTQSVTTARSLPASGSISRFLTASASPLNGIIHIFPQNLHPSLHLLSPYRLPTILHPLISPLDPSVHHCITAPSSQSSFQRSGASWFEQGARQEHWPRTRAADRKSVV